MYRTGRGAIAFVNENSGENDVAWTPDAPWFPGVYNFYNGKLPHQMDADPTTAILSSDSSGVVWLITKRRPQDPIPAIPAEAWFDANMRFIEEVPFYRMAVRRYDSP